MTTVTTATSSTSTSYLSGIISCIMLIVSCIIHRTSYLIIPYCILYCIVLYPILSFIIHRTLFILLYLIIESGGGSFLSLGHNYLVDANGLKLLRERNVRLILFVKDPVKITSSCVLHWHFVGNF
jgi:hypothetical protein